MATETKEASVKRSVLAAAVQAEMPASLAPLARRAQELMKAGKTVKIDDSPDMFDVIWEAGTYLNPTDSEVQDLAAEAWALRSGNVPSRRTISLALGFHRPSALDRAIKAHGKRGEVKQQPAKAAAPAASSAPKGDVVAEQAAKQAEAPKGSRPAKQAAKQDEPKAS